MENSAKTSETPNVQKPTVGRIVHFFNRQGKDLFTLAALVLAVNGDLVDLKVFRTGRFGGDFEVSNVAMGKEHGQWDWPARV